MIVIRVLKLIILVCEEVKKIKSVIRNMQTNTRPDL